MPLSLTFSLNLRLTLYELEDLPRVARMFGNSEVSIYCWKTTGVSNWLERGASVSDVLGFVILPNGLPDLIELPDDEIE
jgi:hypothetical protein